MAEAHDDEFSRYVREARPALRRTAFLLSADWHEADDLVQRTLIALHRRWDTLRQRDKIAGYARTVMLRLIISDRRSHRWSREVLHDLPPEPDPSPDPYGLVLDRLLLMNALAGLGPRQRAAVVLRYWEDRTVEETASALGSEGSTVRSQTVRALASLRASLKDQLAADEDAVDPVDPVDPVESVDAAGGPPRDPEGNAEDAAGATPAGP
ncbi:SigE family RNA polymerase sigma factor [Microbispora sp. ATCC PTA-5024]|uniref:SigE family RNA polymerase sigma factor n=1 Tax=Microbispora sp. ATCC PTA-5024 TaxID=316330 RepID=UPI0003DB6E33|nr:SigE family RNA polymerase sigma factor [Microbispora sp. ATCC PTA-5024]ETK37136.1 RNA polymerase subunit sigma-24 [Microbispora sp. ATCC PTA-5024]